MKLFNFIFLILFSFLLLQCSSSTEQSYLCTQEFVTYSVTVLDTNGNPAESVNIKVTNKDTGQPYKVCSDGQNVCQNGVEGRYTIMHDGFHDKISSDREDMIVKGTKGAKQFKAEYAFRSGKCHLQKLAGPDTVSLSSN